MQDNIPNALIAAFERHYDCSWDTPALRNERLAMRYGWAAAEAGRRLEPPTESEIETVFARLPGGAQGFLKEWGYLQFAREILEMAPAMQSQCLHQIQEPAPVQAAPAAVAVPDERAAFEAKFRHLDLSQKPDAWGHARYSHDAISLAWEAWQARAALAATPAADAPAWDGKLPDRLQRALNELRIDCKTDAVSSLEFEVRSAFEGMHTSLATVKRLYHAAQKRLDSVDAAQADPFAAAAPVVLPEPVAYLHECGKKPSLRSLEFSKVALQLSAKGYKAIPLYTEQQLRALLATGGLPRQPHCLTCNDHGAVGNILTAEPCPDCTVPAIKAQAEARDAWPKHGDLVRYASGSTALALHGEPHAGGWHGVQCMGGHTFYTKTQKPSAEDRVMWVKCAVRYRGRTMDEARIEAGLSPIAAIEAAKGE